MIRGGIDRLRERIERWLFRVGNPDPAPITLVQRRIFVLPTSAGLMLGAGLIVMLLASINYSLGLGYVLVFLLAAVAITSILHAFRNLLHLEIMPGRTDPVFAGQPASFRLHVLNHRSQRRPGLRLRMRDAQAGFDLGADGTAEIVLASATQQRGWMPIGRVTIETCWPLGLIRAWSVIVPDLDCLVFPAPERNAPPLPAPRGDAHGGLPVSTQGDEDFAGLRTHRVTDSPRHVAWKAVARGGPMLTKQFSGSSSGILALDWDSLPENLGVEARLSRLSAWIQSAQDAGLAFSLSLPGCRLPAASGPQHAQACLKQLALF
ncbi:MAG: DUF58 domain-containing protein [Rhodocyclaceae bacterium]|jgi:uncharacterized protein (DUF58 family)|nr:DUF58 domain-containing protein [Rhodocyclaceae bacterium]